MPELEPDPNPLSRIELLRLAQGLGVVDADVMTRAELRAAIDKAQQPEAPASEHQPVTWVSVARRLLASVVERGLNLPDAAALIRGDAKLMAPPKAPPPVATVTLARIYAAQGHLDRAIGTLDEVLESDPDHELARDLRRQLELRRAELLAREGRLAAASAAPDELDAPRTAPAAAVDVEVPLDAEAPCEGAPDERGALDPARPEPPEHDAFTPPPSAAASVDVSAEFVAPPFDTVDRGAAHSAPSAPLPGFYTEPPTMVGVAPLDTETPSAPSFTPDTDPTPTISAGVDWQLGSDSADAVAVARAMTDAAPAWASAAEGAAAAEAAAAAAATAEMIAATETLAAAANEAANDSGSAEAAASEAGAAPAAATALPPPDHAANGIANGVALPPAPRPNAASSPPEPPAVLPRVPGLLLIETDTPVRYIYWELSATGFGTPHWIHVVTHTPTGRGDTERRERAFPVHRQLGALRLEGVPRQAVVRAKLTHRSDDGRPLVVAGSVRPQSRGGSVSFEVRYAPHAKAKPEALASRAKALLERASPVYWDS